MPHHCGAPQQAHISHWVVVDCNVVNDPVASKYPGWLDAGIHILSSNLSGASGSQDLYAGIQVCSPLSSGSDPFLM